MLWYTGHPLIDVGVATIAAYSKVEMPNQVTESHLNAISDYMLRLYTTRAPKNFQSKVVSVIFTLNSGFGQPSYKPEQRDAYGREMLYAWQSNVPPEEGLENNSCVFCGRRAKLRADRRHVPLFTGRDDPNFGARGVPGLAVCGFCMLALHAMPLGGWFSQGRWLVVYTSEPELTQYFARDAFQDNQRLLSMEVGEYPNLEHPKTRMVQKLREVERAGERRRTRGAKGQRKATSLVAYHLTNFGPSPGLKIYELPSSVVAFLREVTTPGTEAEPAWDYYEYRGWVRAKGKTKKSEAKAESSPDTSVLRNALYESLFDLPYNAGQFMSRFLMPSARRIEKWGSIPIGNWVLIKVFLRKVINMQEQRIEAIRRLGDRLAAYVQHRDRRLFNDLHFARYYGDVRLALVKAAKSGWSPDGEPLLPMDLYAAVFEEEDDTADIDWRLARDLLMIRVCETLQQAGWFAAHTDLLEEIEVQETTEEGE